MRDLFSLYVTMFETEQFGCFYSKSQALCKSTLSVAEMNCQKDLLLLLNTVQFYSH